MRTNNIINWLNGIKQYGRQFNDILDIYEETNSKSFSNTSLGTFSQSDINRIEYSVDTDLLKTQMGKLVVDINKSSSIFNLIKKNRMLRYQIQLVDDNNNEIGTCDYKFFIITEIEEQKDKKSVLLTCYDHIIKTMVNYETPKINTQDNTFIEDKNYYQYTNNEYVLYTGQRTGSPTAMGLYENITYPITTLNYAGNIALHLKLEGSYAVESVYNTSLQVTSEHYLDSNGNSLDYTFRDVLDDLCEVMCCKIVARYYISNNVVYISYSMEELYTNTNRNINENYFNEKNVSIGEKYGPINKLTTNVGIPRLDSSSITNNGLCEIQILDNPILDQSNGDDFLDGIFNHIKGIQYYTNNCLTKGLCLFTPCEMFNILLDNTSYPCLLLHDSMIRTTGLKESIYTDKPTQNNPDYKYISDNDRTEITSRNAYIIANKSEGRIDQIVTAVGDNGQVTTASIVQSINDSGSNIKLNADKVYINGVTFDNDQNMTITEGTINIQQTPGDNSLYTYYDDTSDNTRTETSVLPAGNFSDIKDSNNNIIQSAEYFSSGTRLNEDYNNRSYELSQNALGMSYYDITGGNEQLKFRVDGTTGDITTSGTTTTTDLSVSGDATITRLTLDGVNMNNYSGKRVNGASANDLGTGVFYLGSSSSNTPTNYLATLSVNGGTNDRAQFGMSVGGIEAYFRVKPTASWTDWKRLVYIEASGSNSNGNYIKYNDGTLIQWNRLSVKDQAISNSYGSMYIGTRAITFPVAFVGDNPSVQCSCFTWGTSASWGCVLGNSVSLTGCSLCGFDIASRSSGTNVYINWYAIGKWK